MAYSFAVFVTDAWHVLLCVFFSFLVSALHEMTRQMEPMHVSHNN